MLRIGEFAKENNITIRALHHYEKLGLITPAKVDDLTGYRYYSVSQKEEVAAILFLKSLGFSLSEIQEITRGEMRKEHFTRMLNSKRNQAIMDRNSSDHRYQKISSLLHCLYQHETGTSIKEMIKMDINQTYKMNGHELFMNQARKLVDHAIEHDGPLCAMTIDTDRFGRINEKYGFQNGDIVLERIKDAIVSCLQKNSPADQYNSILERDGGDEYRMLIRIDLEKAVEFAENIIHSVHQIDFDDIDDGLKMNVSIGVAALSEEIHAPTQLFAYSTTALYDAKASGKQGVYRVYES